MNRCVVMDNTCTYSGSLTKGCDAFGQASENSCNLSTEPLPGYFVLGPPFTNRRGP